MTPSKTSLAPEEGFNVGVRYYRTYWCPSDYYKFLAKNEQTEEVIELGRWAAPYWQMVETGWQTFSKNLTAPSKPGSYIVKVVGCSGHGTYTYYGVDWNDPRSDGDFRGHRPEEMRWDFYEIAAEFRITVAEEWSFIVINDLHVGRDYLDYDGLGYDDVGAGENYYLTERLKKAVQWVNDNCNAKKIKFVAVLGDISENGQFSEMKKAREILDGLQIPYFPVIGNHDVWSRYNYVKDSRTGVIERSDPVAIGDAYFKDVFFDEEFFRQQCEKLGVTQWDFDSDTELYNYAFVYKGVKFIGLDFVRRDPGGDWPPTAALHDVTKAWLEKHLYIPNNQPILLSHHPMIANKASFWDLSPLWAIINNAENNFGTKILADFAGHIHSNFDEYESFVRSVNPEYMEDQEINKEWPYTLIPVVTTEALMAASNMDGPKGCLRLVKVNSNEDIDYHLIYGGYDFRALNPYFRKITWYPCRDRLAWDAKFELFAFNQLREGYLNHYLLDFGDGLWYDRYNDPSELQKYVHEYPARGGRYTTEFTLSKDDINVSESITRVINLPPLKMVIAAYSPVDITLTDPDGLTTTKQVYEIPESYYYEDDLDEDGDPDDVVTLSELKTGDYLITVQPQPDANLTDTYTLEVLGEDTTVSFVYNVQVAHIPPQSYIIRSTETGITSIIPATMDF